MVWKHLETAGIVGSRDDFESVASGSIRARERFAHAWLDYKGRDRPRPVSIRAGARATSEWASTPAPRALAASC